MYDDDDFNLLDADAALESPLDRLAPVDDPAAEADKPDAEEMLGLLASQNVTQRMIGARAFCELQDPRATALLICLLADPCPLVRVSVAYALGRNPGPEAVEPLIHRYLRKLSRSPFLISPHRSPSDRYLSSASLGS
jgi:HEAT repeat protein